MVVMSTLFPWAGPELRGRLAADPAQVLRDRGVNPPADLPADVLHEFVRVAHLLWVDGDVVPLDRFRIDPADEGLLFGRGAWESTKTIAGRPWLWPLHLDRLHQTCGLLNIDLDPARLPTDQQVHDYVRGLTGQDVVVRLNVSAGRPGWPGVVWMSAAPLPYPSTSFRLRTCRSPVQKGQAYLTLKTFQYATRLRISQQAAEAGFDTALLLDADDNLLEASHANVFVRLPDGWVTPVADGGFLPGTVRQHLLQHSPLPVREAVVPFAALSRASEAFVTNSNAGIVPVTLVDGLTYPVGPETQHLMRWLAPQPAGGVQYRFVKRGLDRR